MAQHFLLSAAARTLSLKTIFSEGEDAAYRRFRRLRWPDTDGAPVCPACGCLDIYDLTTRRRFKCAACHHQFAYRNLKRLRRCVAPSPRPDPPVFIGGASRKLKMSSAVMSFSCPSAAPKRKVMKRLRKA